MIGAAAAYMAGLFFASFFSSILPLIITTAVIAAALIVTVKYGFKPADYAVIAVFFMAAVAVFSIFTAVRYRPAADMDGKSGSFRGEVTDVSRYTGDNNTYILKGKINGEISAKVSFFVKSLDAEYGDIIDIKSCNFSIPSKDYLFDSESYYRSDGIFLSLGSCKDISVERSDQHRFRRKITEYRERIMRDFGIALGGDSGSLLSGMVFGEKRGIDKNVRTAVYRCGIGHMLAVSGLHVSAAVAVLMLLLGLCRVNRYISFIAMEGMIIFLIVMADCPVSAVRAAVMMNFIYAARLFRRQNDTFNSLAGAVLLICIFRPYVIYDEGFILSVSGTFGIGVFAPYMTKNMPSESMLQKFVLYAAYMLCTTLCVFPFSLLFFDETSLISPLTNIIIVPLCSVSMIIGLLYALTGGVVDLLFVAEFINGIILRISDSLSRLGFTHFSCSDKVIVNGIIIIMIVIVFNSAVLKSRKFTCLSIAAALVFLFAGSGISRMERRKNVTVAVLGSGSNAAVVVSCGDTADIIDISGHYRSAQYVRKYLMQNCIERVNTVVLTERAPSEYAAFLKELEFNEVGKWLVECDTPLLGETDDISYFGSSCFFLDEGGFSVIMSEECMSICGDNDKISFVDRNTKSLPDDSLCVCYGKAPMEATDDDNNVLYLDDNNNIEIVLSDRGSFRIRRL